MANNQRASFSEEKRKSSRVKATINLSPAAVPLYNKKKEKKKEMIVPSITVHTLCTMLMKVKAQALFLRQINTAEILKELACVCEKKNSYPIFCPVYTEYFVFMGSQIIQRSLTAVTEEYADFRQKHINDMY